MTGHDPFLDDALPAPLAARRWGCLAALWLALLAPFPALAQFPDAPARQVTLFGVLAVPGESYVDPKLESIAVPLRNAYPNHGFRLLAVQSKRLMAGESLACDFKLDGFEARTTMVDPQDPNGKVQLRCGLWQGGGLQFETLVTTPLNQIFFCDKTLGGGMRILIGIGAR